MKDLPDRHSLARAVRWTTRLSIVAGIVLLLVLIFAIRPIRDLWSSTQFRNSGFSFQDDDSIGERGRHIHAPEFNGAVGWLNVERPLTLADLRGKVVLLDFWTYCCINCMHVIPDLKRLEHKYGNELAVIGVHSAKFQNEKETGNIREAILRYEIEHPVINDANFAVWKSWGVHAWPTVAVIDPDGYAVGVTSGEGNYELLDRAIGQIVEKYKAAGKLNLKPLPIALEKFKQPPSVLSFPGKIVADEKSGRLFLSDSGHNRIVITTLEGKVLDIAGQGSIGRADGDFARATFHHPQGMALSESDDILWVADTENHLLRKVDLKKHTVETVAGNGMEASWGARGGSALKTPLNSPWDVVEVRGKIYIAMAGSHQLWIFDPEKKDVKPFAGNGMENIVDASLPQASLAQPSGITTDGKRLFFADSEVSSVRYADLGSPHEVHTIIGEGLFEFGDEDGAYPAARLQHPLGVFYYSGKVFVADTYNHKIKVVDPNKKTAETFLGTGKPGLGSETHPQFYEPGGVAIAGPNLYIADTNNHDIRVADLKTKKVTTLQIYGFEELTSSNATASGADTPFTLRQSLAAQSVKPGAAGRLFIDLQLPAGFHLNPLAPLIYQIKKISGNGISFSEAGKKSSVKNPALPLSIPFQSKSPSGKADVELALTVYYCRADNQGLCYIKTLDLTQPIETRANTSSTDVAIHVKID